MLTTTAQQTLEDVNSAWKLGYVRLLVFLIATIAVTALHGCLLVLWSRVPILAARQLPKFLAFPRLELMIIFAFVPGTHPLLFLKCPAHDGVVSDSNETLVMYLLQLLEKRLGCS